LIYQTQNWDANNNKSCPQNNANSIVSMTKEIVGGCFLLKKKRGKWKTALISKNNHENLVEITPTEISIWFLIRAQFPI
jgi:hypothetical protein